MKLSDLIESDSSEWKNLSYESNRSEIAFLENKRKALYHQRAMLWQKLHDLVDAGIVISNNQLMAPPSSHPTYIFVHGTGGAETNWKKYFSPPGQPDVERINSKMIANIAQVTAIFQRIKDLTVKGHTFCFTGFRDAEMEQKIRKLGGDVKSSVINDLDCLVADDPNSNSGKVLKARQQGTRIISKQEMEQILKD